MIKPISLAIGLRYTRAKRRTQFISFISLSSMLGVALGVMALITVLSVMNGFEKELKTRILSMVPHAHIYAAYSPITDWQTLSNTVSEHPEVIGAAPFVQGQGMLVNQGIVRGVQVYGIMPDIEKQVSNIDSNLVEGDLALLQPGQFNIVLGLALAEKLGVKPGDKISLIIPEASVSPAGILPRFKRFTVRGIFNGGYQYDSVLAYIHLEDAQKLYRLNNNVTGLQLRFNELYAAPRLIREVTSGLTESYYISDWTRDHGNYFEAVKLEKTIMFIMLLLIIAVAAFNIVSTLVMVVSDKRSEIAILRTIGATSGLIMRIFMIQGAMIGIIGTLLGVVLGVILALNVTELVSAIEAFLEVQFLSADIYYISFLPSELKWSDVVKISFSALTMSLLATLYPAWRASKVQPAEALRYE